jgi:hypothetical protein
MIGERYTVKQGDNLWNIAQEKLGDGSQWPRIWRYNNRAAVIKQTGRGIPDPDMIYPGQLLILPVLSNSGKPGRAGGVTSITPSYLQQPNQVPTTSPQMGPLSRELPKIQSPISIKYRLDDFMFPPMAQPGVILEVKMSGDILLMSKKSYPAIYVTQRREIEAQVVSQANRSVNSLVNDLRLIYDSNKKTLTYRSMLVAKGNSPQSVSTAIGVEIDSGSPFPKLRFEYRFPKLDGSIDNFYYAAFDVKIIVLMTLKPEQPPLDRARPILNEPKPAINWNKVLGVGLLATSAVIVIGTLVEDFFTAGVGAADDPASFTAAAAALARGMQLIRGVSTVLPTATATGMVAISLSVEPSATPEAKVLSNK